MREPARSSAAARRRYIRFLQLSLSCLTRAIWISAPAPGRPPEDDRYPGEWKVRTLAYIYSVQVDSHNEADSEILAWHWHPLTTPDRTEPHMHVRVDHPLLGVALPKLHIPTGRVSFEQLVRFMIGELGVVPNRDDWREIIGESEERFRAFRTWA